MSVTLGPFELHSVLAQGASGVVWRASHRQSGQSVAVKVIRGSRAQDEHYVAALRHEVRSLARLSHPGIAAVLDHGEIDAAAERESEGALTAGGPWLAMEFVEGGSLHSRRGSMRWNQVSRVMAGLLSALGHAHARGVLHRDVKPANVLLASGDTFRPVLTDFGVAHPIFAGAPGGPAIAGTPGYMAPEQREGRWRDFGPWTDLYGLGQTCRALLHRQRDGTARVPDDFEDWYGHLVADAPRHRFRSAADAAAALERLSRGLVTWGEDDQDTGGATTFVADSLELPTQLSGGVPSTPAPTYVGAGWEPTGWREPQRVVRVAEMRLLGLRIPPFVGRVKQRERLWTLVGEVSAGGHRVVRIEGSARAGKSRLARWLAVSAHEAGACTAVISAHSADAPGGGLIRAVSRILGFGWLAAEGLHARAEDCVALWGFDAPDAVALLAGLFHPAATPEARQRGLVEVLGWLAAQRPLVVVVDGAEHGAADVAVVVALAERQVPALVLVVSELAVELATESERMVLWPPDKEEHREIVMGMVPLETGIAGRLVDATLGDPVHALAILRDWVERERLQPDGRGRYRVVGADAALNGAEDALVADRLARFLAGRPADDSVAMELCAVADAVVSPAERVALADALQLRPSLGWVDAAADVGLVRLDEGGALQLGGGAVRQALRASARRSGRLEALHRARAQVLLGGADEAHVGRAGQHLAAAGDAEEALQLLEAGSRWALGRGSGRQAAEWLTEWERAADRADVAPGDPRRGEIGIQQLMAANLLGSSDAVERQADALAAECARHGWSQTEASVWWVRGRLGLQVGRLEEARRWLQRGLAWGEEAHSDLLIARCSADLGRVALAEGAPERAVALLTVAYERYAALDHDSGTSLAVENLAVAKGHLGDREGQRTWVELAERLARRRGDPSSIGDTCLLQGEAARARGDLDAAAAHYQEAQRSYASCALAESARMVDMNLALVQLIRGEWEPALAGAERCIDLFKEETRPAYLGASHALALAAAAALGERAVFNRHMVRAESLLIRTGFSDPDLDYALGLAAERAAAAGWAVESGRAASLRSR